MRRPRSTPEARRVPRDCGRLVGAPLQGASKSKGDVKLCKGTHPREVFVEYPKLGMPIGFGEGPSASRLKALSAIEPVIPLEEAAR
jgi:hypothetical protein